MNSIIEARELTAKYLRPVVSKHGFALKQSASKQIKIEKKTAQGMDIIAFDMLNYVPVFQIKFAFIKINNEVNNILLNLQSRMKLSLPVDKKTTLISFSYNTLNKPTESVYLPQMETEEDVRRVVAEMETYIDEVGIPLLKRFDDFTEIDRTIKWRGTMGGRLVETLCVWRFVLFETAYCCQALRPG